MAQKGTAFGREIMSERGWNDFHGDAYWARDELISGGRDYDWMTKFSRGGANEFLAMRPEETTEAKFAQQSMWNDGYWGWYGHGGSVF